MGIPARSMAGLRGFLSSYADDDESYAEDDMPPAGSYQSLDDGMTNDTSGAFNPGYYVDAASGDIKGSTSGTTTGLDDGSSFEQHEIGDALGGTKSSGGGGSRTKTGGGGGAPSVLIPKGVPVTPAPIPKSTGDEGMSTGAKLAIGGVVVGGLAAVGIAVARKKRKG